MSNINHTFTVIIVVGGNVLTHKLYRDPGILSVDIYCEYKGKLKMLMTRMVGLDPSKSGIKNAVEYQGKQYKFEPIFVFHKK